MKFQHTNPKTKIGPYDRDIVHQSLKDGHITEADRDLLKLQMKQYFEWMGPPEIAEEMVQQGYLAIVDCPQNGSRLCPEKALAVTDAGLNRRQELFKTLQGLGDVRPDWY